MPEDLPIVLPEAFAAALRGLPPLAVAFSGGLDSILAAKLPFFVFASHAACGT